MVSSAQVYQGSRQAGTKVPDLQRVEGFGIPELQGCRILRLQGSKVSRLQGSWNPRLQVSMVAKLQDFRVPGLQGSRACTMIPRMQVSKFLGLIQDWRVLRFKGFRVPRFQNSRVYRSRFFRVPWLGIAETWNSPAHYKKRKMQTIKTKLKQNPQVLLWLPERFLQGFLKGNPAGQGNPARVPAKGSFKGSGKDSSITVSARDRRL